MVPTSIVVVALFLGSLIKIKTTTSVLPKTGIIVAAAGAALVTVSVFSGLAYRHFYGKGKEDADVQVDDAVEGL